jgi:hypothetical protein
MSTFVESVRISRRAANDFEVICLFTAVGMVLTGAVFTLGFGTLGFAAVVQALSL